MFYNSVPTDVINEVKAGLKKQPRAEWDIFRSGTGKVINKIYQEIEETVNQEKHVITTKKQQGLHYSFTGIEGLELQPRTAILIPGGKG